MVSAQAQKYAGRRIGVLMGGMSSEREISLRSGSNIHRALTSLGLDAVTIDIGRDAASQIASSGIDIAFLALHGRYGEDGCIQGLLEIMNIPYTGSGVLGSAIGMSKSVTKSILQAAGIPVPASINVDFGNIAGTVRLCGEKLGFPAVLKANAEGSSVGVNLVHSAEELTSALNLAASSFPDSFIEQYIQGREITVGLVGGSGGVRVLPILELRPRKEFYDFEAKYTKGMTEFDIPARIKKEKEEQIRNHVRRAFQVLSCGGVVRIDAMLDKDENPYFLEVNTLPGMTDTSDIPAMAASEGMSMEELCVLILDTVRQ